MKITININYHSIVDIITNSSTEIFCSISSTNFIDAIAAELTTLLGRKITPGDWDEDTSKISFSMEYGSDMDYIQEDFRKLMTYFLEEKFGKENFTISTDVY